MLVPFNHYCKRYHTNENIACYFFLTVLIIDMIKHVIICKNKSSLYTFLKSYKHALCIRLIGLNK